MIRQFFRQAWTMMKQHKLFTGIYITGTAVSIALTMVLFISFHITFGNIYPEYHRDEMLILQGEKHKLKNLGENEYIDAFNLDFAETLRRECKHLKSLAMFDAYKGGQPEFITIDGKDIEIEKNAKYVDAGWWQVFDYKFIDGRGFTENEIRDNVAVISETLAMQLFASTKVAGREIRVNDIRHRIVGVVKNATQYTPLTYDELWLTTNSPFATINTDKYLKENKCHSIIALSQEGEKEALREEIEKVFHRYYQPDEKSYDYYLFMVDMWKLMLFLDKEDGLWDAIRIYFYIILALLFIPALNLSGMIASRMNSRMVEVGVRRSYGATKREIVSQILTENMILTMMGAVAGLLLSYAVVYAFSNRVLALLDGISYSAEAGNQVSAEMLFNPTIFMFTLLVTTLLNIASALLPTVWALRKDIIQSLYYKR